MDGDGGGGLRRALIEFDCDGFDGLDSLIGIKICGRADRHCEMTARGQSTALLDLGEGFDVDVFGVSIQERGDSLFAKRVQGGASGGDALVRGRRGDELHHHVVGGVFQDAGRLPGGVVLNLAAYGVGSTGFDVAQFQGALVREDGVPEGRHDRDWALCFERVERFMGEFGPRRDHVLLKPVHDFEPLIRLTGLGLVEAFLDVGLELRHGEALVVQVALEKLDAAFLGVHVAVDQARH